MINRLICRFTEHKWVARTWQELHAELIAGCSGGLKRCKRCGRVSH